MRRSVREYVSGCAFCQMRKIPRVLPTGLREQGPAPTEPFVCGGLDHLGPFLTTQGGNKYVLVINDYFSK